MASAGLSMLGSSERSERPERGGVDHRLALVGVVREPFSSGDFFGEMAPAKPIFLRLPFSF